MLRQAADQSYKLNLMTGDSIATSEFWQISGPAGEGTLFTFPTDPRRSPNAAKALEQFKAQGFDPEGFTLFSSSSAKNAILLRRARLGRIAERRGL